MTPGSLYTAPQADLTSSQPDPVVYVTVKPAFAPRKFNVVIMQKQQGKDEYFVRRISPLLGAVAAQALAESWAAAGGWEIR